MSLPVLLSQLFEQTHEWIESQREIHRPLGRPLSPAEMSGFADFYSEDLLRSVRLRTNQAIENPPFFWKAIDALLKLGIQTNFSLTGVAGITFVDCVVLSNEVAATDVLFHELVHVAQYRAMGTRAFAERYIRGLAGAAFIYERNPMEAIAFELQERFCLGARFEVEQIIGEKGLGNTASP